jgi:hypothetical protein
MITANWGGMAAVRMMSGNMAMRGGVRVKNLTVLDTTSSGKLIFVEAKAYIEETVDYRTKAGAVSSKRIAAALSDAKRAFGATEEACWDMPFYQYSNRLAHLYFARQLNGLDAYLLFLYFADAPDVPVSLHGRAMARSTSPHRKITGTWGASI